MRNSHTFAHRVPDVRLALLSATASTLSPRGDSSLLVLPFLLAGFCDRFVVQTAGRTWDILTERPSGFARIGRTMLLAILQFIPLAFAAITPTMVIFVTALLAQDGNAKRALAVVFGRYLGLLVIGFMVLFILNKLPENPVSGKLDQYEAIPVIFLIAGIVLLAVAAYNLVVKKVPGDKNEQSILSRLKRLNAPVLFVACFATAFVSLRQISLVIAGTAIIKESSERPGQELVLLLILCLAMIWPMLIPLGITVGTGERGDELLERLRTWMDVHQQAINSAVLAFFGGILVAKGIGGL